MCATEADPYRQVARYYDTLIEPLNRKLKAIALHTHPPAPGSRVLDVGCGTGTLLELYLAADCEVWGIDASPAMLAVARRRLGSQAHLCNGDAKHMPYEADQFDWVVFTMMLHELPSSTGQAILKEASRVLRPGGSLLVVDYAAAPVRGPRGWLIKALVTAIERAAGGEHWAGYRHFISHRGTRGLAETLELEVQSERVVGRGNLAITRLGTNRR